MAARKTGDPEKPKALRKTPKAADRTAPATSRAAQKASDGSGANERARRPSRTLSAIAEVDAGGISDDDPWTLRLYIAGDSPRSRTALSNLQRLCDTHLKGKYKIEVIDLKTRPELAKADQIVALPTLIRKVPEPMKRLIGDLSNAERAMISLEIGVAEGAGGAKHARHLD